MKKKLLLSLSIFTLLFSFCVNSVSAAANNQQYNFNGKVGGLSIAFKDISSFNRVTVNVSTAADAVFGVDWKTTTQNGGTGGYKIWVQLGKGDGKISGGHFLGFK